MLGAPPGALRVGWAGNGTSRRQSACWSRAHHQRRAVHDLSRRFDSWCSFWNVWANRGWAAKLAARATNHHGRLLGWDGCLPRNGERSRHLRLRNRRVYSLWRGTACGTSYVPRRNAVGRGGCYCRHGVVLGRPLHCHPALCSEERAGDRHPHAGSRPNLHPSHQRDARLQPKAPGVGRRTRGQRLPLSPVVPERGRNHLDNRHHACSTYGARVLGSRRYW